MTHFFSLSRAIPNLFNQWVPAGCFTCGTRTETPLCRTCDHALLPLDTPGCRRCGNPEIHPDSPRCGWCDRLTAIPDHLCSLFPYQGVGRQLFHQVKYHGYWRLVDPLVLRGLNRFFERVPFCDYDAVVPIPQPWARGVKRLFNPADQIATRISRYSGLPLYRALSAPPFARAQVGLSLNERVGNVRGRFSSRASFPGARFLLVDDVLTSGATLEAASLELRRAGAHGVGWLTVFRSLDLS